MTALIRFAASDFGPAMAVRAPLGERLLDVCDRHEAPVPFSCRNATCGTCLVEVTEGAELLDPVRIDEWVVLDALGCAPTAQRAGAPVASGATRLAPRHRLACQATVAAAGVIALRLGALRRGG